MDKPETLTTLDKQYTEKRHKRQSNKQIRKQKTKQKQQKTDFLLLDVFEER